MTGRSVEAAVLGDLKKLGKGAEGSGLGATALALARELDDPENSATSKSMCAKSLQDVLTQMRALTPAKPKRDRIDELASKRNRRRATA